MLNYSIIDLLRGAVALETLNGASREDLLSWWNLEDEGNPTYNDYIYTGGFQQRNLIGKPVGHLKKNGTINNKTYHYEKVLNWIKYGELVDNQEVIRVKLGIETELFNHARNIYNSITQRVSKIERYENVRLDESVNTLDKWLSWCVNQRGFMCVDLSGNLFQADKDVLGDYNDRKYSADNVVFVPIEVNQLAIRTKSPFGKGVQYQEHRKKPYRAYMNIYNKPTGLGYYHTPEEANAAYRSARFDYIDEIEYKYAGMVDDRVWSALMREEFL